MVHTWMYVDKKKHVRMLKFLHVFIILTASSTFSVHHLKLLNRSISMKFNTTPSSKKEGEYMFYKVK
jgi:hypothetical protein